MRVEGPAGLLQALLANRAARDTRTSAAEPAAFTPPSTPQSGYVALTAPSVAMLVTIAANAPDEQRRRAALKNADEGVTALSALQGDLLRGVVSPERLRSLRAWVRDRLRPDEPDLADVLDEIELRLLVELAKLER